MDQVVIRLVSGMMRGVEMNDALGLAGEDTAVVYLKPKLMMRGIDSMQAVDRILGTASQI